MVAFWLVLMLAVGMAGCAGEARNSVFSDADNNGVRWGDAEKSSQTLTAASSASVDQASEGSYYVQLTDEQMEYMYDVYCGMPATARCWIWGMTVT